MSHDVWMEIDTGHQFAHLMDVGNYTRNVSPMWHKAMTAAAGKDMWIDDTERMTGAEALPLFAAAVQHMDAHPDEYEPLNPENGWGDYAGAREFVQKCAAACEAHPKAVLRWSV